MCLTLFRVGLTFVYWLVRKVRCIKYQNIVNLWYITANLCPKTCLNDWMFTPNYKSLHSLRICDKIILSHCHLSIGKKLMIDDENKYILVNKSQNKKKHDILAVVNCSSTPNHKLLHGYRCVLYYFEYSQQLPIG